MKRAGQVAVFAALMLLGLAALGARAPEVFQPTGIYFVDPDAYSRMTRVRLIEEGQGWLIRRHDFENAPEGTVPHTTAPLDWLLVGLAACLRVAGAAEPRDLAGAWISPLLGAVFLATLGAWAWKRPWGWTSLLLASVSPILAHAFSLGRPDHQSLIVLLIAAGLMLETRLWNREEFRPVLAALVWAAALWVSLFEPLLVLAVVLVLRWWVLGREALPADRAGWAGAGIFAGALLLALAAEGWRFQPLEGEAAGAFPRWASTIGELRPAGWAGLSAWAGWFGPTVGMVLLLQRTTPARAWGLLHILACAAAGVMARWGPFFVLVTALALPAAVRSLPMPRLAAVVFLIGLWPVAKAWDEQLFPEGKALEAARQRAMEGPLLREIATCLPPDAIFVAPWWESPAAAYWSRARGVAGSSHQSLPGILETARFYLSENEAEAREVLRRRQAMWVLVDDPTRVVPTSAALLGEQPPTLPLARKLWRQRQAAGLRLVAQNAFYRLFTAGPLPAAGEQE